MKIQIVLLTLGLGVLAVGTVNADVSKCWEVRLDRGGEQWADDMWDFAMTTDAEGNVYLTYPEWTLHPQSRWDADIVTVKYSINGDLIWESRFDGGDPHEPDDPEHPGDIPRAIGTDGTVVCVAGQTLNGSRNDFITICYEASDGAERWRDIYDYENEDDEAFTLALCDGYVYVAGEGYVDRDILPDHDNIVLLKYDLDDGLNPVWIADYNGLSSGNDYVPWQ